MQAGTTTRRRYGLISLAALATLLLPTAPVRACHDNFPYRHSCSLVRAAEYMPGQSFRIAGAGRVRAAVYHPRSRLPEETVPLIHRVKFERPAINPDEAQQLDAQRERLKSRAARAEEIGREYPEAAAAVQKLLKEISERSDSIRQVLQQSGDLEAVRQKAGKIVEQSSAPESWRGSISIVQVVLAGARVRLTRGKEEVCACLDSSAGLSEAEIPDYLAACSRSWDALDITALEAEAAFAKAKSDFRRYQRFADSLRELEELNPATLEIRRQNLETMLESARSKIDLIADLDAELDAVKREAQQTLEFVTELVATSTGALKGKAAAGAGGVRVQRGNSEGQLALFERINSGIQKTAVSGEQRVLLSKEVQTLSDGWSRLQPEIVDYLHNVGFELPHFDSEAYQRAQAEYAKTESELVAIRQLVASGEACSKTLSGTGDSDVRELRMPDLQGMAEAEVAALLAQIGLNGSSLPGSDAPQQDLTAKVERQEPAADSGVRPGATVRYWTYRPHVELDGLFERAKSVLERCDFSAMESAVGELVSLEDPPATALRLLAELRREIEADRAFSIAGSAYLNGELAEAEKLLTQASVTQCEMRRADIARRLSKIGRLRTVLTRVDRVVRACDRKSALELLRRLAGQTHKLLRASAGALESAIAAAEPLDRSRQAFLAGKLEQAEAQLDKVDLQRCPDLTAGVDRQRERIGRLRDQLARVDNALNACDADKAEALAQALTGQQHGALRRAIAALDGMVSAVRSAGYHNDAAEKAYLAGDLAAAADLQHRAAENLHGITPGVCPELHRTISTGQNRISQLRQILQQADAAIGSCREQDMRALQQRLSNHAHVLAKAKLDELNSALKQCAEPAPEQTAEPATAGRNPPSPPEEAVNDCRSNNSCYRESDHTTAAPAKMQAAGENARSVVQAVRETTAPVPAPEDAGDEEATASSRSADKGESGGGRVPSRPDDGDLPAWTWAAVDERGTGADADGALCRNLTEELTRNGNRTQSLARQYAGQKELACQLYRLATEQQEIIQKLKQAGCPGADSIPVTQIPFSRDCP